jgi:hypothetical protein
LEAWNRANSVPIPAEAPVIRAVLDIRRLAF